MVTDRDPLEDILTRHLQVALAIRGQLLEGDESGKVSEVALLLLTRSQDYATAARMLVEAGHWQAAGAVARVVLEDTANLGFIHAQGTKAERFAELYLLSAALERNRFLRTVRAFRTVAEERRLETEALQRAYREFCTLREKLWSGPRNKMRCDTWNGLTTRETFEAASAHGPEDYQTSYAMLCTFSHASARAFDFAFWPELLNAQVDERANRAMVKCLLYLALWRQLLIVADDEFLGVWPEAGLQDEDEAIRQYLQIQNEG